MNNYLAYWRFVCVLQTMHDEIGMAIKSLYTPASIWACVHCIVVSWVRVHFLLEELRSGTERMAKTAKETITSFQNCAFINEARVQSAALPPCKKAHYLKHETPPSPGELSSIETRGPLLPLTRLAPKA